LSAPATLSDGAKSVRALDVRAATRLSAANKKTLAARTGFFMMGTHETETDAIEI
jgi:hypothetical protein